MKLVWVAICSIAIVAWVQAQFCQPGQEAFACSCYQLLTTQMTWDDGNAACSDLGGSLVVLDTPDEQRFVFDFVTRQLGAYNVWLGCKEQAGSWVRADNGRPCTYLDWAPGEPKADDCLKLWYRFSGRMDDTVCWAKNYLICEISSLPCDQAYTYQRLSSSCLTGHATKELATPRGSIGCGLACRAEPRCRSFNLRQVSQGDAICQLNDVNHKEVEKASLERDGSCNYYYLLDI